MKVILAGTDPQALAGLEQALRERMPELRARQTSSGAALRRLASETAPDCIIILSPLEDEPGDAAAVRARELSEAACVLAVPRDREEALARELEPQGIAVVPLEEPETVLRRAILTAGLLSPETREARESQRLRGRLRDIRLMNRAKSAVMKYMGFSEEQAHRYLERQAMDLRITKAEAARRALKMYGGQRSDP